MCHVVHDEEMPGLIIMYQEGQAMIEGKLYAAASPGSYAIGRPNGLNITSGQALEVLLGGQRIAGHIEDGSNVQNTLPDEMGKNAMPQNVGSYAIADDDDEDTVTEASEESFPASDPLRGLRLMRHLHHAPSMATTSLLMLIVVCAASVSECVCVSTRRSKNSVSCFPLLSCCQLTQARIAVITSSTTRPTRSSKSTFLNIRQNML